MLFIVRGGNSAVDGSTVWLIVRKVHLFPGKIVAQCALHIESICAFHREHETLDSRCQSE